MAYGAAKNQSFIEILSEKLAAHEPNSEVYHAQSLPQSIEEPFAKTYFSNPFLLNLKPIRFATKARPYKTTGASAKDIPPPPPTPAREAKNLRARKNPEPRYSVVNLSTASHLAMQTLKLNESTTITLSAVKRAYRHLARKLHPDLHPGRSDAQFKTVKEAYEIIVNELKSSSAISDI